MKKITWNASTGKWDVTDDNGEHMGSTDSYVEGAELGQTGMVSRKPEEKISMMEALESAKKKRKYKATTSVGSIRG